MKTIIFLQLFLVSFLANCQKIEALKIGTSTLIANEFVGSDGFGNYFFLKNEVFHKKSALNDVQYTNFALGIPSKIDILNPLKIVLFYEKFNTVILLDSQLNEIQKIDFSKQEVPIIAAFSGLSSLNNLWIFDSINQQFLLFDLQSNTSKNIGNSLKETFLFCQSNFNYLYWIDDQNELFSISIFGTTKPFGKLRNASSYQIINDNSILILSENQLYLYDFQTKKESKITNVEKHFKNFYYKDQILSIFTDEQIINYKIILP